MDAELIAMIIGSLVYAGAAVAPSPTAPAAGDVFLPPYSPDPAANRAAFLAMIGAAEGADYDVIFGGSRFTDFSRHPNRLIVSGQYRSTAAGRYQINWPTWNTEIQPALRLPDFSPASQDAAAIWLIDRAGALGDVDAGRIEQAISKVAGRWASLPGSPYGQPTRSLAWALAQYNAQGGALA